MFKKTIGIIGLLFILVPCHAQFLDTYVHEGEFGLSMGVGHYFGDLTSNMKPYNIKPKLAAGAFFQKQFNNYVGLKIGANYCFLGYSDRYSSYTNEKPKKFRNLSFNTDLWELNISGSFNFFRFQPGFSEYSFTPYVSLGIGVFSYDPYTYLNGVKYMLRPLGTEGQNDKTRYPNLNPYGTMAMCFPLAFGMKYNISDKINVFGELSYRFTTTDFLDDVSGNYAPDAFPTDANGNPSVGYLLQDRSYEWGVPFGIKGRQRGNSLQKDGYVTAQIGISFNLSSYRCPTY
jgi:hypothetical protein